MLKVSGVPALAWLGCTHWLGARASLSPPTSIIRTEWLVDRRFLRQLGEVRV